MPPDTIRGVFKQPRKGSKLNTELVSVPQLDGVSYGLAHNPFRFPH